MGLVGGVGVELGGVRICNGAIAERGKTGGKIVIRKGCNNSVLKSI